MVFSRPLGFSSEASLSDRVALIVSVALSYTEWMAAIYPKQVKTDFEERKDK